MANITIAIADMSLSVVAFPFGLDCEEPDSLAFSLCSTLDNANPAGMNNAGIAHIAKEE